MKKRRLIPVLLLRNGWIVQSKQFRKWQQLGNPITSVKRLSEWASDELIYLDISRDDTYDLKRDDLGNPNRGTVFEIIEDVSRNAFMPITVGGRIRTLQDIERRLSLGADKVCINTKPLEEIGFVEAAAKEFGSQAVVVSIDFKQVEGRKLVMKNWGKEPTEHTPDAWARHVEDRGAGEVFLNSIDRDGMKNGYDMEVVGQVVDSVNIPVIACGGVGTWDHLAEGLADTGADAVAAANIFHYSDQSVYLAKKHLTEKGLDVRSPDLFAV
ncbi:MAG: imidazole glycerol phosphate synthase cyclase subunit [Sphingomicrobium sp.]